MPGLRDACQQDNTYCCRCEENNCFISLSSRGNTALFVDAEEAILNKPHCDCVIVLKRRKNNAIYLEIYSVELKMIQVARPEDAREALNLNKLRQKCENCLKWTCNIVNNFRTFYKNSSTSKVSKYCIIVIPDSVYTYIANLIKRQKLRLKPSNSNECRILPCNEPITGQALLAF